MANSFMYQIPSIVENLSITSFIIYCLRFKEKYSKKMRCVYSILFVSILSLLSLVGNYFHLLQVILSLAAISWCIIFSRAFLECNIVSQIFVCLVPFVIVAVSNLTIMCIFFFVKQESIDSFINQGGYSYILLIAISKGTLIFLLSLAACFRPNRVYCLNKREVGNLVLVYLSSIIIVTYMYSNLICYKYCSSNDNYLFLYALAGLIVINVITFRSYLLIEKQNKENLRCQLLKLQIDQQKQSFEECEKKYVEIKKIRHDMHNYIESCLALIQTQDYEKAEKYLRGISPKIDLPFNYILIKSSSLINALLNNKLHQCTLENVSVDYKILSDFNEFDELDMCILLGNIWDNAIEAVCKLAKERKISFSVERRGSYLFIDCSNTIKNSVLDRNPGLETTKEKKDNHGLGMISIRDIVCKYNGSLEVKEKGNTISVNIVLTTNN